MKEVTYEDWKKDPTPRMMWCWNDNETERVKRKVVYVLNNSCAYRVLSIANEESTLEFKHCAEIEKPRRMTNQELAWWLQDGIKDGKHRECKYGKKSDNNVVTFNFNYLDRARYDEVCENTLIRENNGEWHEPLVEVEE